MSFTSESFAYFWFPLIILVVFILGLLHEVFIQPTEKYKAKRDAIRARQRVIFLESLNNRLTDPK